jgi:integrase
LQGALKSLISGELGLATAGHYRTAIRAFSRWAWKFGRISFDPLADVIGCNAKEDPRHDRRAIDLDGLRRLIQAAHKGPEHLGLPGPARALTYRLAVATGLR